MISPIYVNAPPNCGAKRFTVLPNHAEVSWHGTEFVATVRKQLLRKLSTETAAQRQEPLFRLRQEGD
jgi:hypothetical protein